MTRIELTMKCPVCGRLLAVYERMRICPAHTDKAGRRCQMSGEPIAEEL